MQSNISAVGKSEIFIENIRLLLYTGVTKLPGISNLNFFRNS